MTHDSVDIRLSTLRAFLGRIFPRMRLVKVKVQRGTIILTVCVDESLSEEERELLAEAGTEIVSDFPSLMIEERVVVSSEKIDAEDIFDEGWVFRRFEP